MFAIDRLYATIKEKGAPIAVGLDTLPEYLPDNMRKGLNSSADYARAITEFNTTLIDRLAPIAPAVKVQVACYESLGVDGMVCFSDTLRYAKERGFITIADVKRNDIGSTAAAYSRAYLPKGAPFESDFITVNGYLGSDGILPFVDDCKKYGKGLFVLVKTSNPGSGELQNKIFARGNTLYDEMATLTTNWGKELVGECDYSSVGAVVGATHPNEAAGLRQKFPNMFFLIPGYGAQGGSVNDIVGSFDKNGMGGLVNNSRGILTAFKSDRYKGLNYADAAYEATAGMARDLLALKR